MRSVQIGVTDVMTNVKKNVLLETQGPCGSVGKFSAGTATDDTNAQVKMSHPSLLASLSQDIKKLKKSQ